MLRALLELAGEVERGGDDEVGVRAADLDVCVEALDVDLRGRDGLLPDLETLPQAGEFWETSAVDSARVGEGATRRQAAVDTG